MATDPTLSYHPTDSLILPTKRRFFPFKIPNYHHQLRHYISTADPDRIYVVVDRVVYSIRVSSRKRETIAVISFEPKCLAAGYGWIGIGGTNNGECAFVKLADRNVRVSENTPAAQPADVDSALPIDLETPLVTSPRPPVEEEQTTVDSGPGQLPEVQLHKFGGSIVNSVTIHRLPGDEKGFLDEDVAVLSNNDTTVTVYSLTRSKVLTKIGHPTCMNYAIISPDSTLLAAVGDETSAYFYRLTRDLGTVVSTEAGEKLSGWKLDLLLNIEMDIGTKTDDKCCFTIAFSRSNRLCAIGSQSGVITIFDVRSIQDLAHTPSDTGPVICHFNSSRACCSGGAVRCMSFSPEPWDLLVWLEDKGRAGIADVRQGFIRRQILQLDMNEPGIEEVHTEPIIDDSTGLGLDLDGRSFSESRHDLDARALLDSVEGAASDRPGEGSDTSPLRESLIQDLTERERLIVEFLNTARWTSRLEDGLTDRLSRANSNSHPQSGSRAGHQGPTSGANRSSRPTSPRPVILSQNNYEARNRNDRNANAGSSTPDPQPSITLSWTASPAELQSATLDNPAHAAESSSSDQGSSSNESGTTSRPRGTVTRPAANFDYSGTTSSMLPRPRNHQRSRSAHRRNERPEASLEIPHSLRANIVAVERLRRQRQLIGEVESQNRNTLREQRYTPQPPLGVDHTRSPRWVRSVMNDLPERSFGFGRRDPDPSSSAGIGWGADGRTLYIATVTGIFEYQLNILDRKTFPVINYR
ncbi:uncharacterized protein BJX67DRAFT_376244 [Aspergillus lucknowensis]|uniref:WD40-repeat-containing domain protein n=1 Tax=Aspergillus lucknowensis TaxID=176173 RepID=A0ABR4M773_9EURO